MFQDERDQFFEACARGDWDTILPVLQARPLWMDEHDWNLKRGLMAACVHGLHVLTASQTEFKAHLAELQASLDDLVETITLQRQIIDQLERENAQLRTALARGWCHGLDYCDG
jgi:hypothetical protein